MNHELDQADHAAHSHNYLELAFILSGQAQHLTVEGVAPCVAGELIVIPTGAWHGYAECEQLELVNCLFSPQLLTRELAWLEADPELAGLLRMGHYARHPQVFKLEVPASDCEAVKECLLRLKELYQTGANTTLLVASLLQLLESLRGACRGVAPISTLGADLHPSVLHALSLLRKQMDADWRLDVLSEQLRLNPSYLVRLFRAQVGEPPMKYLSRMRAERAANYLLTTHLRVGEIGQRVGWPDPKVFSRNFKQHFGQRASEYRKQMLRAFA
jgi:AraC family L-rhamnose operon transcriptional activator RhaR